MYRFEKTVFFNKSADSAFRYHLCMNNIQNILPKHVKLKLLSVPCDLKFGSVVRMRIYLFGIPFFWETVITEYIQSEVFVDSLKKGPFSFWWHQHLFKPYNSGTLLTDMIDYDLPCGIFGKFINHIFVRKELEKIFMERHQKAMQYL